MSEEKVKVTAMINADLVEWVDSMVEKMVFRNRSHGFERAVNIIREHPELLTTKTVTVQDSILTSESPTRRKKS